MLMIEPFDLALDHRDRAVLGVQERARSRDLHGPVEELEALEQHRPAAEDRRVVDENVNPPVRVEHLTDVARHVRLTRHVAGGSPARPPRDG